MTTPMQRYEGTKQLDARPMTRGEYNAYRGWDIPANEDPSDAGYLVEYVDGGTPNTLAHAGYISWSPADVFERTYKPVGDFKDRVRRERDELADKLAKLGAFIGTQVFAALPREDRIPMLDQFAAMGDYLRALDDRIARFDATGSGA